MVNVWNRRVFVSDCEGPIGKNNIAFELASHFIPEGDRIYNIIRMYDYVHANFPKRRDYSVGNAPKLVLPFLLAYDVSNKVLEDFSADNLILLKGSKEAMGYVPRISEAFMVSTSYEHYVRALCREIRFPLENTYSMEVNLDKFVLSAKEKAKLKALAWEIGGMPPIIIPANAKSTHDLSSRDRDSVGRLDKIFWKEVSGTHCKQLLSDVHIVEGFEKVEAVKEISNNLSTSLKDTMYVGDDWTDADAMRFVREGGGLTVAVNGDAAAVRNAELAVLTDSSATIAVLADVFLRFGRAELTSVAGAFDRESLWRSAAEPKMLDLLFEVPRASWPKVRFVSEWNLEQVTAESLEYRKSVVGESVAKDADAG
jgi:energy-converting hydrogenase A subunit R